MQRSLRAFNLVAAVVISVTLFSCSKSSSGSGGSGPTPGTSFFPLAVNNQWDYRLKLYDTTSGDLTDSTNFTLTIIGTQSANGNTYYVFQNSIDTAIILLASLNSTTLGSVDSAYGVNYFTFFVSGSGDTTQSVSSWPVEVNATGTPCEGTAKLYAGYADTTLINLDGIVYTNSMKNVVVTYDCSGNKLYADVYFVKDAVGLVRYVRYVYSSTGGLLLYAAWVLESQTLQ
jgi:hypothetical protein